ncbi:response regulator transcription factor [Paenibacillus typhae]|uniref:Two-component system, response regulator YesN n=1 Tax=Paenibacillus typhae TaxID=1174501 RepID=A0A1G8YQB8_9BACL|nr:response regulator [Paenibacillus typhae]SDK04961.1 two-component system, response regulator YesN [Paenibacillus typhae]
MKNTLISVMLVDDEPIALDNVYEMVPWAENGFQVVAKATSGRMALQLFEEFEPQIVITDISMSPMDGLELGRLVIQRAPKTRLIFLTSYRDFDYARQALEMRAAHYLLKHEISRNRLLEQLKLLKTELVAEAAEEEGQGQVLHIVLKDMLSGKLTDFPGKRESRLHRLTAEYQQGQYAMIYFELDTIIFQDGTRKCSRWPAAVSKRIIEDIRIQSEEVEDLHILEMDEGGYVVLVKLTSSSSILLQIYNLRQISSIMQTSIEVHYPSTLPRFIISTGSAEYQNKKYLAMRQAYDYLLFMSPGTIFLLDQIPVDRGDSVIANEIRQYFVSPDRNQLDLLKLKLENIVSHKSVSDLHAVIDEISNEIRRDGSGGPVEELGNDARQIINCSYRFMEERLEREQLRQRYSRWVNKAMDYVADNYADPDLSLETVASHLQISSIHLRSTFKRETGQSLLDYTTEYRIKLAKQLLQTGDYKIYEVSEKVGYKTSQYFSQVFKRNTGMQPKDFLQQKGGRVQ